MNFEVVTTPKLRRLALREAGVADEILAQAVEDEVVEAYEVFKALKQGQAPTYLDIKRSILGKTEIFHKADNIRRVRALVQAHLERLAVSSRFSNFFRYASRIPL